jgi:hypothetical protein
MGRGAGKNRELSQCSGLQAQDSSIYTACSCAGTSVKPMTLIAIRLNSEQSLTYARAVAASDSECRHDAE